MRSSIGGERSWASSNVSTTGSARDERLDEPHESSLHVLDEGRLVDGLGHAEAEAEPCGDPLALAGVTAPLDQIAQALDRSLRRIVLVDARQVAHDRRDGSEAGAAGCHLPVPVQHRDVGVESRHELVGEA